jgi:hypothetical protein
MILNSISINQQEVSYLIHGQPFSIDYEFTDVRYIIIKYKEPRTHFRGWKKYRFAKASGNFSSISNAYAPEITFMAFGSLFSLISKKFRFSLKVNFINVVDFQPSLSITLPFLPKSDFNPLKSPSFVQNKPGILNQEFTIIPQPIHINPQQIQYP